MEYYDANENDMNDAIATDQQKALLVEINNHHGDHLETYQDYTTSKRDLY